MPGKPEKQQKSEEKRSNIYIHFPFCLYKCHYCDFNSYAYHIDSIPFSEYASSLMHEMLLRKNIFEKSGCHFFESRKNLKTLYFGGGTPSLMSIRNIEDILNAVGRYFSLGSDIEITLEANPKTLTKEKLSELKQIGINRISVGIQSLHDSYLSSFGRIHSAGDARRILDEVSDAGFRSWNADLIFGFPGQSMEEWREDLREILKWNPPHLSCYAFSVEKGTPYEKRLKGGVVSSPVEDVQADMYDFAVEKLKSEGLNHYEISNFSRLKSESQHNLNYWRYGEYLGLGAGAVSFFRSSHNNSEFGYRTTNFKNPQRYMKNWGPGSRTHFKIPSGRHPEASAEGSHESTRGILHSVQNDSRRAQNDDRGFEIGSGVGGGGADLENISTETAMGEYIMMGLRLKEGVDSKRFKKLFSINLEDRYLSIIEKYRDKGWLSRKNLGLTEKGFLFSNQVMGEFLIGH